MVVTSVSVESSMHAGVVKLKHCKCDIMFVRGGNHVSMLATTCARTQGSEGLSHWRNAEGVLYCPVGTTGQGILCLMPIYGVYM